MFNLSRSPASYRFVFLKKNVTVLQRGKVLPQPIDNVNVLYVLLIVHLTLSSDTIDRIWINFSV